MNVTAIIIDDDPVFIKIQKKLMSLTELHNNPIDFGNGKDALEYLQNSADTETTYIIMLNLRMPIMDGWEFLKAVSKESFLPNLRIFIATSSSSQADKEKAADFPFVIKFLEKPIAQDTIKEIKLLSQNTEIFNLILCSLDSKS